MQQFRRAGGKRAFAQSLSGNVRRILRAAQQLLDLRLELTLLAMVHSDLLENARVLELGLEHLLLVALAHAIARFGNLLHFA